MKTLLLSIAALAVAAAPVFGEDWNDQKKHKNRNQDAPPPQQKQVNTAPRSYTPKVQQQLTNRTQALQNNNSNPPRQNWVQKKTYTPNFQNRPRTDTSAQDLQVNSNSRQSTENKWNQNWKNRPRTDVTTQTNNNPTFQNNDNRKRNWSQNNYNNNNNRTRNRNWNWNNNSTNFTFEQARRHHRRDRHDRSWWRSHFTRIALFAGGYYYWNDGYWYPAYGYDPYYSTYTYDEPIYAYNDLQPGEVIVNVQTALQEQGYYNDEVDGLIGPNTRAALRNFQADHGLPVTASIDGPTLQALGL